MKTPVKMEEKVSSPILNYLPLLLIVVGLVLFYTIKVNIWLKWTIVLLSILSSLGAFFFVSPLGLSLHSYLKESYVELGKVVWPTRKEATQFTWIIFIFVVILGLFLWLMDSGISWLFYNVILGRI
jgi:preprotein translocase subunit SecE